MIDAPRIPVTRFEDVSGPNRRRDALPYGVLALFTAAFGLAYTWLSLARHAAFQSHAFDLGNMDQAVWNTLHGDFLRFTEMDAGRDVLTSRLAIHVEPLLAALAPLYLIHSGPETLLVVQALVVATGAIPAYLLARSVLARPWFSLVFPAAYLLHPSLQNAVLDDFHAVTLSASFLMWAIYWMQRDHVGLFSIFASLSMATKEEVGLVVACLGVLLVVRGRPLAGWTTVFAGVAWTAFCFLVVIPAFNPGGHSPYLARYAYLGRGLTGIVTGMARHPGLVVTTLTGVPRLQYIIDLLHPLGFVSVAGFPFLLTALPVLAINMLSADPTMYSGFYQYSVETVPIVVGSAVLGTAAIERAGSGAPRPRVGRAVGVLCSLVLVAAMVDTREYGFSPLAAGYLVPTPGDHQRVESEILRGIPSRAVVAAADEIAPHLSGRPWIYLLPTTHPRNGPSARYIIMDASVPSLPVAPAALHRVAVRAVRSGYGIAAARDGVLLLRRGDRRRRLPTRFFSFVYRPPSNMTRVHLRWGPLQLLGVVIHPRLGLVNRSRPAVAMETYWKTSARVPAGAHVFFSLSPVYRSAHPPSEQKWQRDGDSPTWDWLPLTAWPVGRGIRCDSLPLLPQGGQWGRVDVAVTVTGLGPVHLAASSRASRVSWQSVRLGTVSVEP